MRLRGARADEARRAELDATFAIRSAEDVASELGRMKGAAMKLGQMLSYLVEGLPEPAQQALASLQADVEPMAPSLAEAVVTETLGRPPNKAFLHWEPIPVAAASIGQVHRAVLFDGREVAVKVQYPGVAEAIEGDLSNARWLHRIISAVALQNLDVDEVVNELRDRMREELDYKLEAERQQRFADRYREHPFVVIPDVIGSHSGDRVLTSDWIDGADWQPFAESATVEERQSIGEALFRFFQGGLYQAREFNADPHPGNFKVLEDGRLAVLDFGLVKAWSEAETQQLWPIIDPLLAADIDETIDQACAAGFLPKDHDLDPQHIWEYVSSPYVPFLSERFTYSRDHTKATVARMTNVRGPHADVLNTLTMPASFVLLDRVVWGLTALLGQLNATNGWRAILAEYREGATASTPMGTAEAAWVRSRGGWDSLG